MSGFMLHGLGDCTPENNCGCKGETLREQVDRLTEDCRIHLMKLHEAEACIRELEDELARVRYVTVRLKRRKS